MIFAKGGSDKDHVFIAWGRRMKARRLINTILNQLILKLERAEMTELEVEDFLTFVFD